MTGFVVIIPARYASSRLPGKPLLPLAGKAMVQHVYERACGSGADDVIVATDDERIREACLGFGAHVSMTSSDHRSGTERLAEVVTQRGYDEDQIIVNVQGDEPLIPQALIHQVAADLADHQAASVATLCQQIDSAAELFDPHVVKVVLDKLGYALYFSRAVIPWDRDEFSVTTETLSGHAQHHRHIGLYAYRVGFIRRYVQWPHCPLENMEALEQLRVLWNGARIHVAAAMQSPGHGIDTETDLRRVEAILKRASSTYNQEG